MLPDVGSPVDRRVSGPDVGGGLDGDGVVVGAGPVGPVVGVGTGVSVGTAEDGSVVGSVVGSVEGLSRVAGASEVSTVPGTDTGGGRTCT